MAYDYRVTKQVTLRVAELARRQGIATPWALTRSTGIDYRKSMRIWEGAGSLSNNEIEVLITVLKCPVSKLFKTTPLPHKQRRRKAAK